MTEEREVFDVSRHGSLWGLRNMTKVSVYYIMTMGLISLVRACRQLSGAARAYIPLNILRLPYTSYLPT